MFNKIKYLYEKSAGWPDLLMLFTMILVSVGLPWLVAYKFSDKWFYYFYGENTIASVIGKPNISIERTNYCSKYNHDCITPTYMTKAVIPVEYITNKQQVIHSVINIYSYDKYPDYHIEDTMPILYLNYVPAKGMHALAYERQAFWPTVLFLLIGSFFLYSFVEYLIEQIKQELEKYSLKYE